MLLFHYSFLHVGYYVSLLVHRLISFGADSNSEAQAQEPDEFERVFGTLGIPGMDEGLQTGGGEEGLSMQSAPGAGDSGDRKAYGVGNKEESAFISLMGGMAEGAGRRGEGEGEGGGRK